MESVTEAPTIDSFTPLSEHQESTPVAFFGSQAVLHAFAPEADLVISSEDLQAHHLLKQLQSGTEGTESGEVVVKELQIWVTSENLIIYSPDTKQGFSVAYPAIALHALGSHSNGAQGLNPNAVFLQINLSDPEDAPQPDVDIETLDITVLPHKIDDTVTQSSIEEDHTDTTGGTNDTTSKSFVQLVFAAISACADLHPDPQSPGEDGMDTEPGAGGWITSDSLGPSMDIQFDADGNFVMPSSNNARFENDDDAHDSEQPTTSSPAAGNVRRRDDDENVADGEHVKWQRTS